MTEKSTIESTCDSRFSRRGFLRSAALAGAAGGLAACKRGPLIAPFQPHRPEGALQVALVGCGAQGNAIWTAISRIQDATKVPHIRAVVDINRTARAELQSNLTPLGHDARDYSSIEEMLENEQGLDAVIVATPDWVHHTHTILAMEAGCHVYCEKMMSNRIEWAREMVVASREKNKLLQIGHQRRSSPRYIALRDGIIGRHKGLGQLTHAYGQWHRSLAASRPLAPAAGDGRREEMARAAGYDNVYEYRNWRHFQKYGGGILSDLGAHQIDVFNWFYQALPTSLQAMGGVDYWTPDNPQGTYELPDNVMVMYEYQMPPALSPNNRANIARAYYQTLTTTSIQGFHERFMGDSASAFISELPNWNQIFRESHTEEDPAYSEIWNSMIQDGLIYRLPSDAVWRGRRSWESPKPFGRMPPAWFKTPRQEEADRRLGGAYVDVRVSADPEEYELGALLNVPTHQPHLLNFFDAVEKQDKSLLNCDGEEAFRTTVTVLKVYEALANGGRYDFSPEDFVI